MSEVSVEKITEKVHVIHDRLRSVKSLMTEIMRDITWVEMTLDRRVPKDSYSARKDPLGLNRRRTEDSHVNVADAQTVYSSGSVKRASGLTIPVLLSDAMCDFMGLEHGSKESRVGITREVNSYIKKHSLQDAEDKRVINPDATLSKLVGSEPFHFFQLQSLLKHHYVKDLAKSDLTAFDDDGLPLSELTDDGIYED